MADGKGKDEQGARTRRPRDVLLTARRDLRVLCVTEVQSVSEQPMA